MQRALAALAAPFRDTWWGLERCLDTGGGMALAKVAAGLLAGWWIYVPLHELLHAWACLATGGEVWRLEIDPLYGGALLERWVSFVSAGGEYAGRLSGFDTGGSDLVYLATDLGPFVLTLVPGVWLLRRAVAGPWALVFGLSLPFALAPFLSLTGDAYEIGSIVTTQVPPWSHQAALLRGDDVVLKAGEIAGHGAGAWTGFVLAALVGVVWAYLTWGLGALVARLGGQPAVPPPPPRVPRRRPPRQREPAP